MCRYSKPFNCERAYPQEKRRSKTQCATLSRKTPNNFELNILALHECSLGTRRLDCIIAAIIIAATRVDLMSKSVLLRAHASFSFVRFTACAVTRYISYTSFIHCVAKPTPPR